MEEQQAEEKTGRLRQHPVERFSSPQHAFDLAETAKALGEEPQAGESGHRQKTLYKRGGTTISLFLFGHLTRLRPHRTKGVVSIQVLNGHLRITAEGVAHDLRSGHLLVLAPGVEHDVVAHKQTEMLLTVQLEGAS